ncbi:hypothetical protein ACFDR9_003021 [Janthinobacterium sp. CG_23.3]
MDKNLIDVVELDADAVVGVLLTNPPGLRKSRLNRRAGRDGA